jgi:hypothetical protein
MKKSSFNRLANRALHAMAFSALAASALAQPVAKNIVAEPVAAFPAFTQWVSTVVVVEQERMPVTVANVGLALSGPITQARYEPLPVILGLPELPLTGAAAAQVTRQWLPSFNYQGVHMQQVVLNAAGTQHELRPMGTLLHPGERFKIRITPTFEAVAEVDQVVGEAWFGQRTGQVYPQAGMSVLIKAGQSVDLPIEANGYFWMNRPQNERLVIAVRDPRALNQLRSDQPAYRQDASNGSSYLQLVPQGKFAAVEQLVSQAQYAK